MPELLKAVREHPQLRTQIQEIVQRKNLAESAKMTAIERIVREAKPQSVSVSPSGVGGGGMSTTPITAPGAGSKRPAEEPAAPPSMTKPAAAKAFAKPRPVVPKEVTIYMRFKPLLQAANPSVKGKDFTALVKAEWEKIKNSPTYYLTTSAHLGAHPALLKLKKQAEDEEAAEKAKHSAAVQAWASIRILPCTRVHVRGL